MLEKIANSVRVISADAVENAGSGHPGMPLGCAEIGAYLFAKVMKYNPDDPHWFNRDRLILSAGHGSIWLYALLYISGYDISLKDIKEYRKFGSKTPAHPELGETPGVEMTTGPLGQGLGHAVGIALAEEILAEKYNKEGYPLINHYTYVVAGDGDMMEGISYEAASFAGSLGLGKLIVIYDNNGVSIDGSTDITFLDNMKKRFSSANWQVLEPIDGSNFNNLEYAFEKARKDKNRPTLIIADTVIGKGSPQKEGKSIAHGSPLGKREIIAMKKKMGFELDNYAIPEEVYSYFDDYKDELKEKYWQWQQIKDQYAKKFDYEFTEFEKGLKLSVEVDFDDYVINNEKNQAIRNFGGDYYRFLADKLSYIVGGTADLSGSTRIDLEKYSDIGYHQFEGRNIKFGVREHLMAAAAGGIMLHGGLRPVIATYLTFSDYMRPAIRMAALMSLPVIYIFTHDSIHVGEDGPTHQPVEQLESLRLIPSLRVIRPADGEEVKYAWQSAIEEKNSPVAIILARQSLPALKKEISKNEFEKGAYLVHDNGDDQSDIVILASGSEVSVALKTVKLLEKDFNIKVISVPEKEKLYRNGDYLSKLIGDAELKIAIEAGVTTGWYRLLNGKREVFGVEDFGFSGSADKIADYFGINAEKIAEKIKKIY